MRLYYSSYFHSPGFAWYYFIIRASDVVLSIFDILPGFIYLGGHKGTPSHNSVTPGNTKATQYIKNREDHVTSPYNKEYSCYFW